MKQPNTYYAQNLARLNRLLTEAHDRLGDLTAVNDQLAAAIGRHKADKRGDGDHADLRLWTALDR